MPIHQHIKEDLLFKSKLPTRYFLAEAKHSVVIDYLKATHWRYEHELIPRIEQNFTSLIRHFPQLPNLPVIFNLFIKFEVSLKIHMSIEEDGLYNVFLEQRPQDPTLEDHHSEEHEEPFLVEIISLIEKEPCSKNTFCRVLVSQLKRFEEELIEHAWIEEHIINQRIKQRK
jgi:hypothetical protein